MPDGVVSQNALEIVWKGVSGEQGELFAEFLNRGIPCVRPDVQRPAAPIAKPELRCFKPLRVVNPLAYAYVTLLDAL